MRIGDKSGAVRSADNPLPPQIAALLRESWWLAIVVLALYLALILFTFDKADPGWSHSSTVEHIRNSGGRIGAWLSDILLFVFGYPRGGGSFCARLSCAGVFGALRT
jgi:S-DNA-T family DNA segregation ATPase FtsK/SpoIIIE